MPKLPVVSDRDLIKVLKQLGFSDRPTTATAHITFVHEDGRHVTISRHPGKDIPKGTLHAILRDIKISPDDLRKML